MATHLQNIIFVENGVNFPLCCSGEAILQDLKEVCFAANKLHLDYDDLRTQYSEMLPLFENSDNLVSTQLSLTNCFENKIDPSEDFPHYPIFETSHTENSSLYPNIDSTLRQRQFDFSDEYDMLKTSNDVAMCSTSSSNICNNEQENLACKILCSKHDHNTPDTSLDQRSSSLIVDWGSRHNVFNSTGIRDSVSYENEKVNVASKGIAGELTEGSKDMSGDVSLFVTTFIHASCQTTLPKPACNASMFNNRSVIPPERHVHDVHHSTPKILNNCKENGERVSEVDVNSGCREEQMISDMHTNRANYKSNGRFGKKMILHVDAESQVSTRLIDTNVNGKDMHNSSLFGSNVDCFENSSVKTPSNTPEKSNCFCIWKRLLNMTLLWKCGNKNESNNWAQELEEVEMFPAHSEQYIASDESESSLMCIVEDKPMQESLLSDKVHGQIIESDRKFDIQPRYAEKPNETYFEHLHATGRLTPSVRSIAERYRLFNTFPRCNNSSPSGIRYSVGQRLSSSSHITNLTGDVSVDEKRMTQVCQENCSETVPQERCKDELTKAGINKEKVEFGWRRTWSDFLKRFRKSAASNNPVDETVSDQTYAKFDHGTFDVISPIFTESENISKQNTSMRDNNLELDVLILDETQREISNSTDRCNGVCNMADSMSSDNKSDANNTSSKHESCDDDNSQALGEKEIPQTECRICTASLMRRAPNTYIDITPTNMQKTAKIETVDMEDGLVTISEKTSDMPVSMSPRQSLENNDCQGTAHVANSKKVTSLVEEKKHIVKRIIPKIVVSTEEELQDLTTSIPDKHIQEKDYSSFFEASRSVTQDLEIQEHSFFNKKYNRTSVYVNKTDVSGYGYDERNQDGNLIINETLSISEDDEYFLDYDGSLLSSSWLYPNIDTCPAEDVKHLDSFHKWDNRFYQLPQEHPIMKFERQPTFLTEQVLDEFMATVTDQQFTTDQAKVNNTSNNECMPTSFNSTNLSHLLTDTSQHIPEFYTFTSVDASSQQAYDDSDLVYV